MKRRKFNATVFIYMSINSEPRPLISKRFNLSLRAILTTVTQPLTDFCRAIDAALDNIWLLFSVSGSLAAGLAGV